VSTTTSSNDIQVATALSIFCSQYSTNHHWGDLLRQELPELTDEDIEWLCGLTQAEVTVMESPSHEPAVVHKDPGRKSTCSFTALMRSQGQVLS
jgi:hypothetical protein